MKLVIEFANKKALKHFMSWLDEQGEQDYWTWMECCEQEEKGNITVVRFDYDYKNQTIQTECSRLDSSTPPRVTR